MFGVSRIRKGGGSPPANTKFIEFRIDFILNKVSTVGRLFDIYATNRFNVFLHLVF